MNLNWTKKSVSDFYTTGGLHFRVSVASWLPWAQIHYTEDGKIAYLSGHLSLMLKNMAAFMGFNYTLVAPTDGQWGAPGEGDNWTGMIGMLQRDEADIAMGPFAITYLRAQVVDYTMLFTTNYLTIMAGRLKGHHTSFFSYILTFGWQIWLGILLSWIFLVLFLTISEVVHYKKWQSWHKARSRYIYNFWIFFSNIFCESSPNSPEFTSGRILVTVWWLALIVLMNGFSGNLKAMMMIEEEPERIDSIQDILSRKHLRPIIMKGTAYETYIKNTHTEEFQQLYKKVVETDGLLLHEMYTYRTLRQVLRGERVIVNDYWSMSDALSRRCANLTEGMFYFSKLKFFHHPFAVALNKRLPKVLALEISKRVSWIFESSILSRWSARMIYNWDKCTAPDIFQEEKPLKLADLEGFFILYTIVSAFCFLFLLLENTGRIVKLCKRCLFRRNKMQHFYEKPKIATLRVAVCEWLPWTGVKYHHNGSVSITGGFMKSLLNIISSYGRFNYAILSPKDKQWGTPLPNGSFTGMIGMLERNESDIGLGPFTATYPRWSVARFGKMFRMMHLTILAGAKESQGGNVFSYILTFDWQTWLVLFMALILATIVSSIIDITVPKPRWRAYRLKSKLGHYFWEYIGTLFYESMPDTPASNSGRIIIAVWWMSIIVLMNGFTGNMKATMLVRPELDKINSVKELVQRPYIRPIIMKGTAYETYIKTSESKDFRKLWKMIINHNGLLLPADIFNTEILEEVRVGKAVIISDRITLKYNVAIKCMALKKASFYFSRESFYPHLFTVSHRKDLRKDVLKLINSSLRRLFEAGVWKRMLTRVNHDFGKCAHQEQDREEQILLLEDLEGIFILYFICLLAAGIILVAEQFIGRKKKNINLPLFLTRNPIIKQKQVVKTISKVNSIVTEKAIRNCKCKQRNLK